MSNTFLSGDLRPSIYLGFTLPGVIMVEVDGIGANTRIFGIRSRVVFTPLPPCPRDPSTFSEGVWGGFGGSKCLLRRYLDP